MKNMDEKKRPLANLFKLNAPRKKGLSLGRRQNGSPNHSPKEKGTKLLHGIIFIRENLF
jgi:hypothetical protein